MKFVKTFILLAVVIASAIGCTLTKSVTRTRTPHLQGRSEAQGTRIRELERKLELACIENKERARTEALQACLGKSIPEIEADIGMKLRQRFDMGEPELDVEVARQMFETATREHETKLKKYRDEMAQWEADKHRLEQTSLQTPTSSFGCDVTPTNALRAPPVKPRMAIAASEIPLKMSLRIATKVENGSIGNVVARDIYVPPEQQSQTATRTRTYCDDASFRKAVAPNVSMNTAATSTQIEPSTQYQPVAPTQPKPLVNYVQPTESSQ